MRKLTGTTLVATVVAVLTTGAGATSPAATTATTWTVKPGGSFSGSASDINFRDTTTNTVLGCLSSSLSGTFKSGSGLAAAKIARFDTVQFSNCAAGPITGGITNEKVSYYLNAKSYTATKGETTVIITHMQAQFTGPGCAMTIDGTGAGADDGTVTGRYTNSSGKLAIMTANSNLHFYKVVGCFGLFKTEDGLTVSAAAYVINPAQTITSP